MAIASKKPPDDDLGVAYSETSSTQLQTTESEWIYESFGKNILYLKRN